MYGTPSMNPRKWIFLSAGRLYLDCENELELVPPQKCTLEIANKPGDSQFLYVYAQNNTMSVQGSDSIYTL